MRIFRQKDFTHSARTDSRKYFLFSNLFYGNEIKIRLIASDNGTKTNHLSFMHKSGTK
jgi:hypothetical protein